ncbi:MAG TPA: hypothetical protein VK281_20955 [Xanthobacteraceae bacterium]|nr:hypothetical protein [Xanthobacteraceae bacterium]
MSPGIRDPLLRAMSAALVSALAAPPAQAIDEIQVYNADIAEVGQWTIEQHLNYVFLGRTQPDFPGGLISNHSLNGTPELAYGVTDWWEIGFYAPFSVQSGGRFFSDGFKFRNLFVTPDAEKRNFFYGINFELGFSTPRFSQTTVGLEVRPIIGVRNSEWVFIVNPIVDLSFGSYGEADFVPAARVARKLDKDLFAGLEYYGDFGEIGNFLPLQEQQHTLFAVTDFKVADLDVELGVGYGLTSGSDRLVAKAILGYAFPVPGAAKEATGAGFTSPLTARSLARSPSASLFPWNAQ